MIPERERAQARERERGLVPGARIASPPRLDERAAGRALRLRGVERQGLGPGPARLAPPPEGIPRGLPRAGGAAPAAAERALGGLPRPGHPGRRRARSARHPAPEATGEDHEHSCKGHKEERGGQRTAQQAGRGAGDGAPYEAPTERGEPG